MKNLYLRIKMSNLKTKISLFLAKYLPMNKLIFLMLLISLITYYLNKYDFIHYILVIFFVFSTYFEQHIRYKFRIKKSECVGLFNSFKKNLNKTNIPMILSSKKFLILRRNSYIPSYLFLFIVIKEMK